MTNARNVTKVQGPLYEQMAAFRARPRFKNTQKWILERKKDINKIYDAMKNAKSQ